MKISRVRLEKNDRGFSLSYEKQVPRQVNPAEAFAETYRTEYLTESFGETEAQKAFDRFLELSGTKVATNGEE